MLNYVGIVTLKGDDEHKFRGFVLQARGDDGEIGIGTFTVADKSGKILDCSDSKVRADPGVY